MINNFPLHFYFVFIQFLLPSRSSCTELPLKCESTLICYFVSGWHKICRRSYYCCKFDFLVSESNSKLIILVWSARFNSHVNNSMNLLNITDILLNIKMLWLYNLHFLIYWSLLTKNILLSFVSPDLFVKNMKSIFVL